MNARSTCAGALLFLAPLAPAAAQTAEESGNRIAVEADLRARGYGSVEAHLTMSLQNRHGESRSRRLTIRVLEGDGAGERTLLVFDEPADLAGTALLTHSSATGEEQRWLYLPALRRVKRVASADRSDSFVGTEFSYEDIGNPDPADYVHRLIDTGVLNGVPCWIVERTPKDAASGYSRQQVWFDQEAYRIRRIDYYDRDDNPLKRLDQGGFQLYEGRFWRPSWMLMTSLRSGDATRVEWSDLRIGTGLSERDFEPGRLGRGGR